MSDTGFFYVRVPASISGASRDRLLKYIDRLHYEDTIYRRWLELKDTDKPTNVRFDIAAEFDIDARDVWNIIVSQEGTDKSKDTIKPSKLLKYAFVK